ncbi:MAG: MipA/OmpV family protein [Deltaproteobacteria bacterium]|nr:MipA/OmpV family protein [Candidatus Anaeroferrophillus wilburensis]MBN2887731.1 MipA/OmpV family protein [Deltaproteobacteria bacterium]
MKHSNHVMTILFVVLVLCMTATAVNAEEKPAVSLDAEVLAVSKYIWRGLEVNEEFVLQPSLTAGYGGFSFNIWGNMDLTSFGEDECVYTSGCDDRSGQFTEIDLTMDYTHSWDAFTLGVGIIAYEFPNWEASEDTHEFYVSGAVDTLLQPSLTIYYDFDEVEGLYASFGIGHSFAINEKLALDLSASVGYADGDYNEAYFGVDDSGFVDLSVGVSLAIPVGDMVTITPMLSYTSLINSDLRDAVEAGECCNNEDNFYGGIAIAVSF